jgi:hypothetical protein
LGTDAASAGESDQHVKNLVDVTAADCNDPRLHRSGAHVRTIDVDDAMSPVPVNPDGGDRVNAFF